MLKIKRKINITNIYIGITIFFIVGFVFFGTSKMFIAEKIPMNQTELNKEYDLRSNGKFEINSWVYDEDKEQMEITLITNGIKDYKTELDFSSVTRKNTSKELPLNVVYEDSEIYVIKINNVEEGFQQIALRLHKTDKDIENVFEENEIDDKEDEEEQNLISTIYTDERKVERNKLIEKEEDEYVKNITDDLIKETNIKKENKNKKINTINEIKESLVIEIENLEEDLLYQTTDEQVDTSNDINKLKKEIETYDKELEEIETDINNLDSKITRLNQKKRDLEI